jgi:hypothetical protein
MGSDFERLQPELQEYFALAPGMGKYGVGEGVFEIVGCRQSWLRPLLKLTSGEEAFFPEYGEGIPFRIENHAHLDPFGRSSLTARREIYFPGMTRLFHDTTSLIESGHGIQPETQGPPLKGLLDSPGSSRLMDYVGRYRRVVTDLELGVTDEGRLRGVSGNSRLFLGPLRIPLPKALDAKAFAEQWWDASEQLHRIQVKVIQPQVGLVLVYAGRFEYRLLSYPGRGTTPGFLPAYAQPDKWESRT